MLSLVMSNGGGELDDSCKEYLLKEAPLEEPFEIFVYEVPPPCMELIDHVALNPLELIPPSAIRSHPLFPRSKTL